MNGLRQRITDELDRLDRTGCPAAIARDLKERGVKGVTGEPRQCPLARHLMRHCADFMPAWAGLSVGIDTVSVTRIANVFVEHGTLTARDFPIIPICGNLSHFVELFDNGRFAELLEGYAE